MHRRTLLGLLGGTALLPAIAAAAALAPGANRRVILLELAGANDGLNTVVPYRNDHYHKLRPTLALRNSKLIQLDQNFAFNSALKPLMPLWEKGELAIVQGLGYPKPNRSHFSSIALWETGGDGHNRGSQGWLSHDMEHACATQAVDACGISLGGTMGIFSNSNGAWLSMNSSSQFHARRTTATASGITSSNPLLNTLATRKAMLDKAVNQISAKLQAMEAPASARRGSFNDQLNSAINLINAGVNAPVLKLSLKGFDTHDNQTFRHHNRLSALAASLAILRDRLGRTDNWRNTLVVTYSEFGRTPAENGSGGTDHGTVAPHFVAGGAVNGGFYGEQPGIPDQAGPDMQHTMDYRALYSQLLHSWLATSSNHFAQYTDSRLEHLIRNA